MPYEGSENLGWWPLWAESSTVGFETIFKLTEKAPSGFQKRLPMVLRDCSRCMHCGRLSDAEVFNCLHYSSNLLRPAFQESLFLTHTAEMNTCAMNAEQRRELANPAIRDGLVMVTGERNTLRASNSNDVPHTSSPLWWAQKRATCTILFLKIQTVLYTSIEYCKIKGLWL